MSDLLMRSPETQVNEGLEQFHIRTQPVDMTGREWRTVGDLMVNAEQKYGLGERVVDIVRHESDGQIYTTIHYYAHYQHTI